MKYSFMSFSCPERDVDGLIETAEKYGYEGVEPRVASRHAHGIELEADKNFRSMVKRKFSESGIQISCLATSCKYADPASSDEQVSLTEKYIELARDTGAPGIRVFGGLLPEGVSREDAIENVSLCLGRVSAAAEKARVAVYFETHDDWCDPEHVAEVMKKAAHPFIRVNWDIMHPVRRAGKTVDESFNALKPWIAHVHFHDGVTTADGKPKLLPVGEGIIDHRRAAELLSRESYGGFLSGEWINWEPCDAHLPREIATMRNYEKQLRG